MAYRLWQLALTVTALLTSGHAALAGPVASTTRLWHGGTIITMEGETPRTVEAVVERGGKIVFAGNARQAKRIAGRTAAERNLKGATMLPGFVDAHSHFAIGLQTAGSLDLSDPAAGDTGNVPALIAAVQRHAAGVPKGGWVVVWRYDETTLSERRNITRAELDAALPDNRVVLIHVSVHGLIANSKALEAGGVRDGMPVPEGGVMPSDAAGRLTGLLFEKAMTPVMAALPQPSVEAKLAALAGVQMRYAREGFTMAQDGATNPTDLAFLTSSAARARFKIDLALLPFALTGLEPLLSNPEYKPGAWFGRIKLQGVKFTLDGSPQARTAFFTRDYANGAPDGSHPWHGQPVTSQAEFEALTKRVHDRGWQIFVHANGDAAIDMAIRGFDALGIKARDNRRPVVIHSQFMRPDQLPAYARIGVGPAYFSNHTYYFADTHRTNFPDEVVGFISPFAATRKAGLVPSNHSDFPVTGLDTRFQMWSAMTRTSRTGVVSGADQRDNAYQALQSLTTGPAWQAFEDNRRGRIKAGLLADFVVLDRNPLTTPVADMRSIKVLETVKEGQTVWKAP